MQARPRIYITGAPCAGVTTLGAALAARLKIQHVAWLSRQTVPVLRLDGIKPPAALAGRVIAAL